MTTTTLETQYKLVGFRSCTNRTLAPAYVERSKLPPPPSDLDGARSGQCPRQDTTWLGGLLRRLPRLGGDGVDERGYVVEQRRPAVPPSRCSRRPGDGWLMLEPSSMLWNTRYGMR